ncbi:MAG: TRAM domain-containing protein [bacterium]|nr:TRAM domain-containing protein [bacterium]
MKIILIRSLFIILSISTGWLIGLKLNHQILGFLYGALGGVALFFLSIFLRAVQGRTLAIGAIGAVSGLIISNLLFRSFLSIPSVQSTLPPYFYLILNLVFGYLGVLIAVSKGEEIMKASFSLPSKLRVREKGLQSSYKILDTSVVIDGRIADICEAGFMEGILLVPRFVLRELQHIADSPDVLKRNRGRRGLEVLNRMQKRVGLTIKITDIDFPEIKEVDGKLVQMAKQVSAKIITNDYNLNKIAELEGATVLNVNELAEALKPVVLPGEEMAIHIIKEGKEPGQGVAYLDDGTMVVVDNGKGYIGQKVTVSVTSVLQTTAGRMIFTKLQNGVKR